MFSLKPVIRKIDEDRFYKEKDMSRHLARKKKTINILEKVRLKLARAGFMNIYPGIFFLISFVCAVAGYLIIEVAFKSIIFSVPAAIGAFFIPNIWLNIQINKRKEKITSQFVEVIEGIANFLRAGISFRMALERISERAQEPIRTELLQMLADIKRGSEVKAVEKAVDRMPFLNFKNFALAVNIHGKLGGDMAGSLESLATLIKDKKELNELQKANTAEVRITSIVVGLAPVVMFFVMWAMSPDYVNTALSDIRGKIGYALGFILAAAGYLVVRKIGKAGREEI